MPKIKINSLVNPGAASVEVLVDAYGRNPILEDALQVISIRPKVEPPKMFSNGTADLPAFTASGVDPALLLQLPYTCRHWAAALADPAQLHAMFEQVAGQPTAAVPHEGFDAALGRMRSWTLDIGEAA